MVRRTVSRLGLLALLIGLVALIYPLVYGRVILDPALVRALQAKDLDQARSLVLRGANVNVRLPNSEINTCPVTPLMVCAEEWWAASPNDPAGELARHLIRRKADVHACNRDGMNALMLAAIRGNPAMVRLLLKAGADPNARSDGDTTVLMWTTSVSTSGEDPERKEVVRLLLAAGADMNAEAHGTTALAMAEKEGCQAVVAELRRHGARGLREALDKTPGADLLYAVQAGEMDTLKQLVDRRVSMDVRDAEGSTPIILAARRWDAAILRYLLRHASGITPDLLNAKDHEGQPAITWAARYGRSESVVALLQAGADPNVTEAKGWTALHFAAYGGDLANINALIAAGANVRALTREGETPLTFAVMNRHPPAAQALRNAGA